MEIHKTEPEQLISETAVTSSEKAERSSYWRFIIELLETVVLSVLLFLAIDAVSARIRVDGISMEPTLKDGEFVYINKLAYKLGKPKLGDVIVFHFPQDPKQEYIKRVVGLPGDTINIVNGAVHVNGSTLEEPYINQKPDYQSQWQTPEEHLFVLGDNRNNSSDSHRWGPVPMENIVGKAIFVYWPPKEWGMINHPTIFFSEADPSGEGS